jgi:hypothetical protein
MDVIERARLLSNLGPQRGRVLQHLGGNEPDLPGYLKLSPDTEILEAFGRHVRELSRKWAADADPAVVSLLAAGRLLSGDLSAADTILDHLPAKPFKTDHGAGIALVMPLHAMRGALPLPPDLADTNRWIERSPEQASLRDWLSQHRDKLRWMEREGEYRFDS